MPNWQPGEACRKGKLANILPVFSAHLGSRTAFDACVTGVFFLSRVPPPKGQDVQLSDCASVFGRHEFLIRRLHSLSGLVPIGGYLAFHLATNAAILDGVEAYQHRADQIHALGATTILVLEWSLIFLPILFHGIIGMLIVCRGKRNLAQYSYTGNIRYTLQRTTGVIAMLFILWHVFHMHGWFRWSWWVERVAEPLGGARFDPGVGDHGT